MNKYSYYFLILIVSILFTLTGLGVPTLTTYNTYIDVLDTHYSIETSSYYRQESFTPISVLTPNGTLDIDEYDDLYGSTNDGQTYKTICKDDEGFYNLLVLPVSFSDSTKENLYARRIDIHNAFFGERNKNTSFSVSEYYNISSYGNVKLRGEVAPYFNLDLSSDYLKNLSHTKSYISRYITTLALKNFVQNGGDLSSFDTNNDNFIDGLFVIYDFPYSNDNDDLYWAYVDHSPVNSRVYLGGDHVLINDLEPYISSYGWASYDFMHKSIYSNVDAHVYTHEVGHLFGLLDYYSSSYYQPLGYLDMMDFNIGDHNAFSKYLLNWTSPIVIKDEGIIELSPFATSGQFILIPSSSYSDNPFGQYLLLEFYSPTGVNSYDSELSFYYNDMYGKTNEGRMYTNYGVKLYHVDARIAYFEKKNTNSFICYTDDYRLSGDDSPLKDKKSWCTRFFTNNDNSAAPLIKLIEKGETNYLKSSYAASNDTLFKEGDVFKMDNLFSSYSFYGGENIPFGFKIENISPDKAMIRFSKI